MESRVKVERRVFVSVNNDSSFGQDERRRAVKAAIVERLRVSGYSPQLFFEVGLPLGLAWTFENVVGVMRRCVGAIVIGFPRWRATSDGEPVKFVGEFLHFEGAAALTLGLPTLIAAEPDVLDRGILYRGGGMPIARIPPDATPQTVFSGDFDRLFVSWMATLGGRRDVFLGYCSKAQAFAAQIEMIITRTGATVHNWAMDFRAGSSILEEISAARELCSRAIFVFSEDDPLQGTEGQAAPRDNVVFEAGYFISAKGAQNTLIIRIGKAKIPADLGGSIYLNVPSMSDGPAIIEARLRDFVSIGAM